MTFRLRSSDIVHLSALVAVSAIFCSRAWAVNDPIAYWNFNTLVIPTAGTPAALGITSIAPTTDTGSSTLSLTGFAGNIDDFSGTALNADTLNPPGNGNVSLSMLPGASPGFPGNGGFLEFQFSMTGRTGFGVSYATQSSSTGFNTSQWSYSTDAHNFTNFASPVVPGVERTARLGRC